MTNSTLIGIRPSGGGRRAASGRGRFAVVVQDAEKAWVERKATYPNKLKNATACFVRLRSARSTRMASGKKYPALHRALHPVRPGSLITWL